MTDKQTTDTVSLGQALVVFGYADAVPSHQRYTLLSTIALSSGSNGRPEIEDACEAMMSVIREGNASD